MVETAHLNAALHFLLQSSLWMQHAGGAKHLVCNQVLHSIRNKRTLLNGVKMGSPLLYMRDCPKEYERVYHISMPGSYGRQLNILKLYFRPVSSGAVRCQQQGDVFIV